MRILLHPHLRPIQLQMCQVCAWTKITVTAYYAYIMSGLSLDISAISAKRRLVEKILKNHGRTDDDAHKLDIEISSYLACKPTASEADDAMLFWKTYAAKYPTLQHVARCYLSISASSVPVESMFSTTGLILNSKRSSLVPHKLNYITFIHDNCC